MKKRVSSLSLLLSIIALIIALFTACEQAGVLSESDFVVGMGSENASFVPDIEKFGKEKGWNIKVIKEGSVDLANSLAQGKAVPYDAIWPASSALIAVADKAKVVKQSESIMWSPIVPIVKESKAKELGWLGKPVTNSDFFAVVESGKLPFAMTSASQSYSGQAAYTAFLYRAAGNPDMLLDKDVNNEQVRSRVKNILSKVSRSSSSSGFLKDMVVANSDVYQAMYNYEAMAFEVNQELSRIGKERMCVIIPADGVTVADFPFGYIDKGDEKKEAFFKELKAFLKSPEMQKKFESMGRRVGLALLDDSKTKSGDACFDTTRNVKIFPTPEPQVVSLAVEVYQSLLRKPSLTFFLLDYSGSMRGDGVAQVKEAMALILDPEKARQWLIQPTARDIMYIVPFNSAVIGTIEIRGSDAKVLANALNQVNGLDADGGTDMYNGLLHVYGKITQSAPKLSEYSVSVIVMTDGKSQGSSTEAERLYAQQISKLKVPIYSITFGDADISQLEGIGRWQDGRNFKSYIFDGSKGLVTAFRKARSQN